MSSSILSERPRTERRSSRVPGGFDPDEEDDVVSIGSGHDESHLTESEPSVLYPAPKDPSSLLHPIDEKTHLDLPANNTFDESDMNNKLLDQESSFLPERSPLVESGSQSTGADDTHLFGVVNDNVAVRKRPHPIQISYASEDTENEVDDRPFHSPKTPPGGYKTPAPEQQDFHDSIGSGGSTPPMANTSALENMSSSPTAAAAARTLSRVQSLATMGGYETAHETEDQMKTAKRSRSADDDSEATPRRTENQYLGVPESSDGQQEIIEHKPKHRRPGYLQKRSSQARLSFDSIASSNTDASDATIGADFALQSGGALPDSSDRRKTRNTISRQASLGSMLSGVSGMSDDEHRPQRQGSTTDLHTLEEESPNSNKAGGYNTPRASVYNFNMPSNTVIANNVRDLEVPGTFARQYRQERSISPEKSNTIIGLTPGTKRGLTLKEHRSTVENLGKENFDLKMKIHFLDQALQKRSEDGVKELITENVQLKSDRLRLEKDNHNLRKSVRICRKSSKRRPALETRPGPIRDMPPTRKGVRQPRRKSSTSENGLRSTR